jgi:GNAT superfamily N-acetyltransferase
MILPREIAEREEARLSLALSELADSYIEVGGGVACYGGSPESWMNLVVGVGMRAPVGEDDLDRIVTFFDAREVEPRVEVCPFADRSFPRGMSARGFGLSAFETVLYRELASVGPPPRLEPGIVFDPVDGDDDARVEAFVTAHLACFAKEPGPKAESMAEGARRMVRHPRTIAWLIRVDGELAGAGALELLPPLATLIATGVCAPFRGRGLQSAFIAHRCAVAREAGCTLATIGSDPASPTGRNAHRAGFATAYTKAILERSVARARPREDP